MCLSASCSVCWSPLPLPKSSHTLWLSLVLLSKLWEICMPGLLWPCGSSSTATSISLLFSLISPSGITEFLKSTNLQFAEFTYNSYHKPFSQRSTFLHCFCPVLNWLRSSGWETTGSFEQNTMVTREMRRILCKSTTR